MGITTKEYTGQELSVVGFIHITGLPVKTIIGCFIISQSLCSKYRGTIGHRRNQELVITLEGYAWLRTEQRLDNHFLELLLNLGVDPFSKNPLVPVIDKSMLEKRKVNPLWYPS